MAAVEENIDQVTDEELFNAEAEAAPSKEEPVAEKVEAEPKGGKPRDDKGRFASNKEDEAEEPEPPQEAREEPEQAKSEKPEPETNIPSWRLKEEADARREWQQRAEQAERDRIAFQQQLVNLQQQLEASRKPEEPIDIFAEPDGINRLLNQTQQTFEHRLRAIEGNMSLRLAKATHKETFDEAWAEMERLTYSGDDSMRQQVMASSDPGETLVKLYKQVKVYKEADGDLGSFIEKQKAEWLKDPEVQKKVLEAARQTATNTQPQQPNVTLPPSLNKATGSGNKQGSADASDAAMWQDTLRG